MKADIFMQKSRENFLRNYYAVEILDCIGIKNPSQEAIDDVERILQDETMKADSESLHNYLIIPKETEAALGKALLIEHDPMLLKAHYILLSNAGLSVDTAVTREELISKSTNTYQAVFGRPYEKPLNGWVGSKLFMFLPKSERPKIFMLVRPEESVP